MSVIGCLSMLMLCAACWGGSIYVILIRRFQNQAALLRYNYLVLLLMLINICLCIPILLFMLTVKLPLLIHLLLVIAVVTDILSTGGLVAFGVYSFVATKKALPKDTDYLVILGAATHHGKVSPVLATRLIEAKRYWEQISHAKIIVTGGIVHVESIAEAKTMAKFLTNYGIPANQINIEDQAANTWQNLCLSAEIIGKKSGMVVVITSDFHVLRVQRYLKKLNLNWQVHGAATPLAHRPLTFVRDYLGNIRDQRKVVTAILVVIIIIFELLLK